MIGKTPMTRKSSTTPIARLRPIADGERRQHPWLQAPEVVAAAICGATTGCDGWLAAVREDSGGTLRQALIPGSHRNVGRGVWLAQPPDPPRRRRNLLRGDLSLYYALRWTTVRLSAWPTKIQCPLCGEISRIVVPKTPLTLQHPL